jgi:hypothetical protein
LSSAVGTTGNDASSDPRERPRAGLLARRLARVVGITLDRAVQRLRFAKLATVSGWLWLVELSNHAGALLLLLAAVGVSAFSAVKLPDWWWGALILFGFYVLLFGEGAFRLWREYGDAADRRGLELAARQLRSELLDIQEKVALIDATVAGHTYWDGFAFPADEWHRHRDVLAENPALYEVVEAAYVTANRANEIIAQRRTRASNRLIGRADEEDLPGVSALAGKGVASLDKVLEEENAPCASSPCAR